MKQNVRKLFICMVSLTLVCQATSLGLPPQFGISKAKLYSNRNYEITRKIQEIKRKKQELLRSQQEAKARSIISQFLLKYGSNVLMDFYSGRY